MGQKQFQIMDLSKPALQYVEKQHFIYLQRLHIRTQSNDGVTAQMATIRCRCGWNRGLTFMHQCLYCKEYFCQHCAELHFGKSVKQYRVEVHDGDGHENRC